MTLNQEQQTSVMQWIRSGQSLSEVQSRLKSEYGVSMTFMEVRFLVDDLNLELARPAVPEPAAQPAEAFDTMDAEDAFAHEGLSVEVDSIVTPGSIVSGSVRFSDGVNAKWHIDQMGRLGLTGVQPGYQPDPGDIQEFQILLQQELRKKGMA
jgi:hypothetical protein